MKRLKMLLMVAVGVCALASVLAASAFASGPTLLFPSGGGPTVLLNIKYPNSVSTELQNELLTLKGTGLLLEITLLQTRTGVLGSYLTLFLGVEQTTGRKPKCNSVGDREGEVLLPKSPTILLVYDKLGTGTALGVGALFTVPEFEIECEALLTKISGTSLGLLNPINTAVRAESDEIKGSLTCSATVGTPAETQYWNTEGREGTAELIAKSGGKKARGCELIGTTPTSFVTLLPTKEIEIDG